MSDIKSIKVLLFTEKSDWNIWSKKFLASAHIKGYKDILVKPKGEPMEVEEDDKAKEARLQIREMHNDNAYNDLIMSFDDAVNFALVDEAKSDEFPEGDAEKAWKNLLNRHEPSTTANEVQLKWKFHQSKLGGARNDPDVWIAGLEKMRQQLRNMKSTITDEDLIIHIVYNLPREYEGIAD